MKAFFFRFVFWYLGSRMINYDDDSGVSTSSTFSSGGVTVRTAQSPDGLETNSTLTVRNAGPGHSGNYTCLPSNAKAASIQVFVSEGQFFNIWFAKGFKAEQVTS
jgi:hypothetical protein